MSDLLIERLLDLPLEERGTILLSTLLDPVNALEIVRMDNSFAKKRALLEDLLALPAGVRTPVVLTLLKEVFSIMNSTK